MFSSRSRLFLAALAALLIAGCSRKLPVQPSSSMDPSSSFSGAASSPQPSHGDGDVVPGEYLVMLRAIPARGSAMQTERLSKSFALNHGITPRHSFGSVFAGFAGSMSSDQAAALAADPAVASVEPNRTVHAFDQTVPSGVTMVKAPTAHARGTTGSGIKVGVIDTGIDYTHPDLAANYAGGVDFVNHDSDPMDDNGHGTHVSGTIAAVDNAAGVIGVAPAVQLYGIKVLGAQGGGTMADVIAGIDWAVANGMKVVNLSLGASVGAIALQTAVDNAYHSGVVVCAAAGNSGGKVGYPGAYASCICVSAVDNNKVIASFSSRGPEVDVAAPGVSVLSTWPGGSYARLQGTSMATPHVTGVAALVWSTGRYTLASQVRERILGTCADLGAVGVDPLYGKGLVNAEYAASAGPNHVPVVRAGGPYSAVVNLPVVFAPSASDADGSVVAWAWDFGDGTRSSAQNPTHRYARVASFTARLTVTDDRGGVATAVAAVVIKPVPPDTVSIDRCSYTRSTKTLFVTATSSNAAAKLSVEGQGAMTFDPSAKRWSLSKVVTRMPSSITVASSHKGTRTKAVTAN